MISDVEKTLESLPAPQWVTQQAIIFDWHDGPREGICALISPPVEFAFELLDERFNSEGLDDLLFRLKVLAPGAVSEVLTILKELGPVSQPVWVPMWKFSSSSAQQAAEKRIEKLLRSARPTSVVIATQDMVHFEGLWKIETNGMPPADWSSLPAKKTL